MDTATLSPPTATNKNQSALPEAFYYRSINPTMSADKLPLRSLKNVSIYDKHGEFVGIEKIERQGPFSATGIPGDSGDSIVTAVGVCLIQLDNITEYSLEYPYGKPAIIWLQTRRAYYSVDSLSDCYEQSGKGGLFKDATICGNVINAFINLRENRTFARVMLKAMWLSGMSTRPFFDVVTARRQFLLDQFAQQQLKNFNLTRVYKILADNDHWSKSRVVELMLLVEREVAKQRKQPDLVSSDDEEGDDADSVDDPATKENAAQPKKIRLDEQNVQSINGKLPEEAQPSRKVTDVIVIDDIESPVRVVKRKGVTVPKDHQFAICPNTLNTTSIELPTEMALHYNCPFCQLTLKRTHEHLSIVQLTVSHFEQHLSCNRFVVPVNRFTCPKWPRLCDAKAHHFYPHFTLQVLTCTDRLPIRIV